MRIDKNVTKKGIYTKGSKNTPIFLDEMAEVQSLNTTSSPMINDLHLQKSWCKTVLQFMIDKFGKSQGLGIIMEVVEAQCNTNYFESIKKDLLLWSEVLSAEDFNKLDKLLIRRFQKGFFEQLQQQGRSIKHIQQSRRVDNDDEYRLVLSYINFRSYEIGRMENSLTDRKGNQKATVKFAKYDQLPIHFKQELKDLYALLLTYE